MFRKAKEIVCSVGKRIRFVTEYFQFKNNLKNSTKRFPLRWKERYPCLNDNLAFSSFDRHYVYHPAWAASIILKTKPDKHVDISSTLHFCSLLSVFIPVDYYDYRPANLCLPRLNSNRGDLLNLPFSNDSVHSISCMHVVEHIGLGRYGDKIDPDADLKAIRELIRVLAYGGNLLFVVPVGAEPKILFNAHRIYSIEQVVGYFSELDLKEMALIPDNAEDGGIVTSPGHEMIMRQKYACGCFWFSKKQENSN